MKIIINKIIISFLLLSIFSVTKGFCFDDLLNSSFKVNAAGAEIEKIDQLPDMCQCCDSQVNTKNNSILPCCLDENHPTANVLNDSFELEKYFPQLISNTENNEFILSEPLYYQAPIIAPPELYSIQKTILRL